MEALTPYAVRQRAEAARIPVSAVLTRAKVQWSTFWRWEGGAELRPYTRGKIQDALDAIEAERRQ